MKQLLYFSAPWCGPCRTFKPVIESLQSEISITFYDVDSSPQETAQYNVRSVPTVVVVQNGMEIGRAVGAKTKAEIRSLYNR